MRNFLKGLVSYGVPLHCCMSVNVPALARFFFVCLRDVSGKFHADESLHGWVCMANSLFVYTSIVVVLMRNACFLTVCYYYFRTMHMPWLSSDVPMCTSSLHVLCDVCPKFGTYE